MLIALCTDQAKQKRKYISILNDIHRRDFRDFVVGYLKPKIGQRLNKKRTEKKKKERTKQKMDNYK